uniref:Ankyrinlike protein putative n=1 Tax=Albugo laibachii Nc14 TaxID=890382 RepID=F0WEU3_9STRA|nr:ankyrinlike protein putative [Albugo laibachii Nc14]|eukprot:CCA19725.1 ankyrinlike protein putative [Albugo laibachii Nc14]
MPILKSNSHIMEKRQLRNPRQRKSVSFADRVVMEKKRSEGPCQSTTLDPHHMVECPPLHAACLKNDIFVVKHILSYYQKESMLSVVNSTCHCGTSPLQTACRFGYFQLAQMLLLHGADPNSSNFLDFSDSCFQLCIMREDLALMRLLIDNAYRILDADVSVAMSTGNSGAIKEILVALKSSFDRDQDVPDGDPLRRLYRIASMVTQDNKCSQLLRYIVKCDQDPKSQQEAIFCVVEAVQNAQYSLLYHIAKRLGGRKWLWQYRHESTGKTLLHDAVIHGDPRIMNILLRLGVDANARDHEGVNPLYIACARGHQEAAKLLLEAGASASTSVGPNAQTPLHIAAQENRLECVKLLLQQEAVDIDARTLDHCTALHLACQSGNTAVADCLLKCGANPHAVTVFNETSLLKADRMSHSSTVKLLQKHCQPPMRFNAKSVTSVGNMSQTLTTSPIGGSLCQCFESWTRFFANKKRYLDISVRRSTLLGASKTQKS